MGLAFSTASVKVGIGQLRQSRLAFDAVSGLLNLVPAHRFGADFVAEIGDFSREVAQRSGPHDLTREQHSEQLATGTDYLRHASTAGGGRATSFATRRRFWAIAPSVNSSCAPYGPHNRSRPSLKMRSLTG